ncbi:4 TMS phage holin, superfamily IV [Desulfonispora thiosulfatigenes DSM 11270]|uniref:4 TMS phage holin, superfamily IV n=1 Tax=Desulfonispora thiosulfatigenes DSM 11270 TaxID=656914 RepID=A0A1W1VD21_DESTI|nr:phage holin family protein [Desulfonispora thiosulfatigenes]SMB90844.1 4 TMS phage holin, superfamily IV [Desulfonispora thiosulfatigenes DSM 11270]
MISTIVRFIVSAFAILFTSWLLPGVTVSGFWGALIAAVVIAGLGWGVEKLLGEHVSPASRGLTGFVTAAVVIYVAQMIIPNQLSVSLIGAMLAAFVIGIIDYFVPTAIR